MQKNYISLGLMSGTSGDGVDASIIKSNGVDKYEVVCNSYYEYDSTIYKNIHSLKQKISNIFDLEKLFSEIIDLERKITLFHAKVVKEMDNKKDDLLVGFHGQTIFHDSKAKISRQLGDGKLLSQLTRRNIVFNFRKNDLLNGGEGAPLASIFHKLITQEKMINLPICFLNIGGISNITIIKNLDGFNKIFSKDIGPGNCLIDTWVRNNSNKKFDFHGELASRGEKNQIILEQAQELYSNRQNKNKASFDTSDFDISFSRGLSLEDGTATLTDFTAKILGDSLLKELSPHKSLNNILICGGGRKNSTLIIELKKNLPKNFKIKLIDEYNIDGDFVESQAFAFLAIRSFLNLPITFPNTTGCLEPCLGGELAAFK